MQLLALVALAVLVACGKKSEPPQALSRAVAFVHVTVVPMDREHTLLDHTVIVERDRIIAVGPAATTPVPVGAKTIDGRGKWLVPGLADMHAHTYDPRQLALFVSMGVTTIRVMWGDPASLGARDAIKRGEPRLAPSIYTAGNIVDGERPVWPGSLEVKTKQQAEDAVKAQHRAGYDFIKVYAKLAPEVYDMVVATAKTLGMPVAGHVPSEVGLAKVLAAKQLSVEHLDGYPRFAERDDSPLKQQRGYFVPGVFRYSDDAKLADAVARTKAAGLWNCPTLVVMERMGTLDNPDTKRPELRYVSKAMLASWDPAKDFRFRLQGPEAFQRIREMNVWGLALVKRLADADAPLLACTDFGNPWLVPGFSLHDELALFVAAKLTPYQALRAATEAPGRYFEADFGVIAVGKRADLVLLDADPLARIENTRAIAGVMLRGTWYMAAELAAEREMIAEVYAGTRSRFENVAPVASNPTFTARYRITGDFQSGEERITAFDQTVIAEQRNDGEAATRWMIVLGDDGAGAYMEVKHDGLDVTVTRRDTTLHVAGSVGKDTVSIREPIATDEILGGTPLGVDSVWQRRLVGLAVDETTTLKLAVLELHPAIAIRRIAVTAKRLADGKRGALAVRIFEIAALGHPAAQRSEIAIDERGWPVETATHVRCSGVGCTP